MLHPADYPALAALAAVLRAGSFERAAAELGVTPSAISQRVKALEERMGAALIRRGQPAQGTIAGLRLARHAAEVGLLEAALAADLGAKAAAPPVLRIAVPADSLATWFLPALAAAPGPLFDIVIDDQDHSAEWLRQGEVSAAVTAHARPVPGCDAAALGRLRYLATASPDFSRRWFPKGATAEALSEAPALTFNMKDRLQRDWAAARAGRPIALRTHYLPSSTGFVEAGLLGLGWSLNPEPMVRDHLASGRLVRLSKAPLDTPLSWQWNRMLSGPLAALTKGVRQAAAKILLKP
jgi:LysR family transcriptional regulator (chromosome initiation inhibitor)